MSNTPEPILVDAQGAAAMLAVGKTTFYAWVNAGIVPPACVHHGKVVRWRVADIKQAVETLASRSTKGS